MRGLTFILGFVIGNDAARKWCIEKINEASRVLEKEFKKSPMAQLFKGEKNDIDGTKNETTT